MPELFKKEEDERIFVQVKEEFSSISGRLVNADGTEIWGANLFRINYAGVMEVFSEVDALAARKAGITLDEDGRIKLNLDY